MPLLMRRLAALTLVVSSFAVLDVGADERFDINEGFYCYLDWNIPHRTEEAVIQYIYDGDTIQDRFQRRIRLLGVNTPEVAHPEKGQFQNQPGAIEATRFTERLVRGKQVYLIVDPDAALDPYGRTLALVFVRNDVGKWICVNWELVRNGLGEMLVLPDNKLCLEPEWYKLSKIVKKKKVEDFQAMARMYLSEGLEENAVQMYQEGIRQFPEARVLYEDLGQLYLKLNLPGFTVDAYLAYVEKHPRDFSMRYQLARTYERMADAAGMLSLVDYKKKAQEEWKKLLGTEYDQLAKDRLGLMRRQE